MLVQVVLPKLPFGPTAPQLVELVPHSLKQFVSHLHDFNHFWTASAIPELSIGDLVWILGVHFFGLQQPPFPQLRHVAIQPEPHHPQERLAIHPLQIL